MLGFPPANDLFAAATALSGDACVAQRHARARGGAEPGEPAHARRGPSARCGTRGRRRDRVACRCRRALAAPPRRAWRSTPARVAAYAGRVGGAVARLRRRRGARKGPRDRRHDVSDRGRRRRRRDVHAAGGARTGQRRSRRRDRHRHARVVNGTTAFANSEDDEPSRAGHAADASVWYRLDATARPDHPEVLLEHVRDRARRVRRERRAVPRGRLGPDASGRCASRAALTLRPPPASIPHRRRSAAGAAGAFELSVGSPPNDDVQDPAPLSGADASGVARTEAATTQDAEPADLVPFGRRTAWWSWTAAASGAIEINTCGSSYSTTLAVYHGTPGSLTATPSRRRPAAAPGVAAYAHRRRRSDVSHRGREHDSGGSARVQSGRRRTIASRRAAAHRPRRRRPGRSGASAEDSEPSHGSRRSAPHDLVLVDRARRRVLTLDSCGSPTPVHVAAYRGSAVGADRRDRARARVAARRRRRAGRCGSRSSPASATGSRSRAATTASGATLLRLHLSVDSRPPVTTIDSGPPALTNAAHADVHVQLRRGPARRSNAASTARRSRRARRRSRASAWATARTSSRSAPPTAPATPTRPGERGRSPSTARRPT